MKQTVYRILSASLCVALTFVASGTLLPESIPGSAEGVYRNIALRRAAYHSSAGDFFGTAQLVTDGIFSMHGDEQIKFSAQHPNADSPGDEQLMNLFDGMPPFPTGATPTKYLTFHRSGWIQIRLPARIAQKGVSAYIMASAHDAEERDPADWTLQGSDNGTDWTVLDTKTNFRFTARRQVQTFTLAAAVTYTYYRLDITATRNPNVTSMDGRPLMQLARWDLLDGAGKSLLEDEIDFGFNSVWVSAGAGEEWVYVDLGGKSKFDKVTLHWPDSDYARQYELQISDDAKSWSTVFTKNNGGGGVEACGFAEKEAVYVRLLCKQSNGSAYALSELEVWGSNAVDYQLPPLPAPEADGTQQLRGGNWRVERASEVSGTGGAAADGVALSKTGFNDTGWLPATVPGTVLTSYFRAGAVPDMRIADNVLQLSDSFFTADFWYRNTFTVPAAQQGKRTWLNFDAVNWKAEIWFNGSYLGRIDGAFLRGRFDITGLANYGGDNCLAVYIHANDNPGSIDLKTANTAGRNGGVLGQDNPTIHASIGWDWVPTIPGRNIGIYGDVFLSYTEDIAIADPLVITKLSDNNTKATLTVKALLSNPSNTAVNAKVSGIITPSGMAFETTVNIPANTLRQEYLLKSDLVMNNPNLWWPNTYGDQPLYTMSLTAANAADNKSSDALSFRFGVREFTYKFDPSIDKNNKDKYVRSRDQGKAPLSLYCNGVHIVMRGGNWGMDDANLAATADEYDVKVRLHAEANFTMIRNWVGMTRNPAFYDACDRYGILIWNDYWMANPGDGPNPGDEVMFMANAVDSTYRIRRHAALAIYAGRNEGPPPDSLDIPLRQLTKDADGSRFYVSFSADNLLTGEGFTYSALNPWEYFQKSYPDRQLDKIMQIEKGFPNVPAYESLMKMLTGEYAWPRSDVWGIHDFCNNSAQNAAEYEAKLRGSYGTYDNLRDFARTAQMQNYEGMKALYDGMYYAQREGLMMWMSQSAWPSMVWQTYDYYYDTNGGFFGAKKGAAPVSAYWANITGDRDKIFLRNYTQTARTGLRVVLNIFDIGGALIHSEEKTMNIGVDAIATAFTIPALAGKSDIRFIQTAVYQGTALLSDNFYWYNVSAPQEYKALSALPWVELEKSFQKLPDAAGGNPRYAVTVKNPTASPALMIRLKTLDSVTGEQLLPVYYDDNYISLMPGQSKVITLEIDCRFSAGTPQFELDGWNIVPTDIPAGQVVSQPRPFLRATVNNLYDDAVLAKTKAPAEIGNKGAYIQALGDGSFAAFAGLRENDIIAKYNGYVFGGTAGLAQMYSSTPNGGEVILKVWREDRYIKIAFIKGPDNNMFTVPARIQADEWTDQKGTAGKEDNQEGGQSVAHINAGEWVRYQDVHFVSIPTGLTFRAAVEHASGTAYLRLDSPTGPLIATAALTNTGGWFTYRTFTLTLADPSLLTGVHDVYLCFGTNGYNTNWFEFTGAVTPPEVPYGPGDPDFDDEPPPPPIKYGDINGDNKVDITDARLLLQHLVGKHTIPEDRMVNARVSGGAAVTISDARLILQWIVDKIDRFPVEN
ncbi:MAG: carbohydrate-binding protein [Oscillospiraceae bacterium]|nr:carbohydrate-binding protein [Oscillospiraceae bacterium]